jgi:hypothetical protein
MGSDLPPALSTDDPRLWFDFVRTLGWPAVAFYFVTRSTNIRLPVAFDDPTQRLLKRAVIALETRASVAHGEEP